MSINIYNINHNVHIHIYTNTLYSVCGSIRLNIKWNIKDKILCNGRYNKCYNILSIRYKVYCKTYMNV